MRDERSRKPTVADKDGSSGDVDVGVLAEKKTGCGKPGQSKGLEARLES